ncbi:MAG TPA: glycosyltransferase family 4 protein [Nitrospirales bacterium]|nr:glycosyltransferase family 4 protein [Nitrospirales bacterium]HIC04339.1 glycosyltransferase family 4 protein [Nitrospirales bacterium]HIN33751.1 glycosyltransferase family 4 protein [Nitrospirales bacterium]HIO69395.1 glycosyltransferase family 4 protein [Nitrospirales bacterium]
MKVALVHDWLTGMRGGERVLHSLCELFPNADLFTLLHIPGSVSPTIERLKITPSFLQHVPFVQRTYRNFLPLFPFAIEQFKLSGYDLIISSSHCVAKGITHAPDTCHISYIHTPMRYAWDLYSTYLTTQKSWFRRMGMRLCMPSLRRWDVASSRRVNYWIANSSHVAERIKRLYDKDSHVVYPPVDIEQVTPSRDHDDFYLMVSALVPYKRVDLAIQTFTELKKPLVIIGSGPEDTSLRGMAGPTIRFLGWQPDNVVQTHYQRCRALVLPGLEDFGIVPVEAMAAGKAVIAYQAGGVMETVVPLTEGTQDQRQPTGILFPGQSISSLSRAIGTFEANELAFDPDAIGKHAQRFNTAVFRTRINALVYQWYNEFTRNRPC